jgi:hypothetical protein
VADNPGVQDMSEPILPLVRTASMLPWLTDECTWGFSLMNNIITDLQSSL